MNPLFIATPSGQFVAFAHLVSLDIEATGRASELRHEVQATAVTGERHVLHTSRGPESRARAEAFLQDLLRRAGAEVLGGGAWTSRAAS